jgi:hypothetical protein
VRVIIGDAYTGTSISNTEDHRKVCVFIGDAHSNASPPNFHFCAGLVGERIEVAE